MRWTGRTATRCLLLAAILWLASGCATGPTGSTPYRPKIPPRPVLTVRPDFRDCQTVSGQQGRCVDLWMPDLEAITRWGLDLERELKGACLALGGMAEECRTEPEP